MSKQWYIGIDIGSTAAKAVALGPRSLRFTLPTGWSSRDTADIIQQRLQEQGIALADSVVVSTGYGRQAVQYANKKVTEITCHAAGCAEACPDCSIIDVGGQDTKAIHISDGAVDDFIMNDKCSAGTGKFIEVMANRLDVSIDGLFALAAEGQIVPISSLCTVFAESEIIGYIGQGKKRQDIAAGIVNSVSVKVAQLAQQVPLDGPILLSGGLSHLPYFAKALSQALGKPVQAAPQGRYAGAYGAALLAQKLVIGV
ncbi:MAG: acyl-CoA dehydratase activase [Megasphaera sp.]|jgi:predicted CoA-substrate-specific enzyme activase|nr:acyl-CoA dehydratase activase [Megasphaera sp.]MCH4188062.1 acyl-CoA dehydratase activase [Megasphaera sp.]